jgi:putative inorganic carbon (hco3(-)) transporter
MSSTTPRESGLMPILSLDRFDQAWTDTLNGSAVFKLWLKLKAVASSLAKNASGLGSTLQTISFALVVLMFFVLAAPQFANDKGTLALLVVAAFGLRLLGTVLGGKERYKPSAIDALVLLYLGIYVVSTFASHYLMPSIKGLAKMVVYFLSYFLLVDTLQQSRSKRQIVILAALVLGGFLVSMYGLYQYKIGVAPLATWEDPNVEDKMTRIYSTLGNPNLLAGYLVPIAPVAFALALIPAFGKGLMRWLCIPLLGVAVVISAASWLTGSRGGWLGLLAALGCFGLACCAWLWQQRPKLRPFLLIGAVVLPLAAAAVIHFKFSSYEHRFLSMFAGSEHSSNAYRMNVYRSSFKMFQDNWWIGIGAGNETFRLAYGLYMRSGFDALGTYCVPLEVAVETGVVGLLSFLALTGAVLARAHQRFWETLEPTQRLLSLAAMSSIVGMIMHGLVDTVFYRPQVQFVFWLMVALVVALHSARAERAES